MSGGKNQRDGEKLTIYTPVFFSYLQIINRQNMTSFAKKAKKGLRNIDSDFQVNEEFFEKEKAYKKWSIHENKLYAEFLLRNFQQFEVSKERRSLNFFNKMADSLQISKNNLQCRSHHQKMLCKYKSVDQIISALLGQHKLQEKESENKSSVGTNEIQFKVSTNSAWAWYTPN